MKQENSDLSDHLCSEDGQYKVCTSLALFANMIYDYIKLVRNAKGSMAIDAAQGLIEFMSVSSTKIITVLDVQQSDPSFNPWLSSIWKDSRVNNSKSHVTHSKLCLIYPRRITLYLATGDYLAVPRVSRSY